MNGILSLKKVLGLLLTSCTTYIIIKKLLPYYVRNKSLKKSKNDEKILKVLFFPDPKPTCALKFASRNGCTRARCNLSHEPSFASAQLLSCLFRTKHQLDVCIYVFTAIELGDLVINLHRSGVNVRVITDDEQVDASSSQIDRLRQAGIQARHDASSYLMHHKFAIVDKKLLINGSFNWTLTATTGNNENLMITNDSEFVDKFSEEFEKLWNLFDPKLFNATT
ncbi:hypothetical protein HELRODRAFT_111094 [Helobdella robusta]|uniref:Mitochondrial cardiolipin hydrolase n=1 Tax=Helobdella robusta TaxID=6412 RepID=T1EF80_HELRO|nr:hypothetical protein HELRODRAFT_111094 [Helobdella robusta]ESO05597.1 hypothetical protein HELRODRAFT_111094 [Helobdella robusta]